jgi:hypothetical protein
LENLIDYLGDVSLSLHDLLPGAALKEDGA